MKTIKLLFVLGLSCTTAFAQQKVKDGTDPQGTVLPNEDAILELESTNKGLLHTRIELLETTDPSPLTQHVAGMMVYNTVTQNDVEPGIYYNDGTRWVRLEGQGESGNAWSSGPGVPTQAGNNPGDQYLNTGNGRVYQWDGSQWNNTGVIRGPEGPAGPAGVADPKDLTNSDGSLTITNGIGATIVDATISVTDGGITDDKIANGAVTPAKLSANMADAGKVAVVQSDGSVLYQDVAAGHVTGENLTTADGSIEVLGGTGATLKSTQLNVKDAGIIAAKIADGAVESAKIAEGAVTPDKLSAGSADAGSVATVGSNGSVTYETPTVDAEDVTDPKDLTGDNSIDVTDGDGATLKNTQIKVADAGISAAKIAPNAVTTDKIADGAVESDKIAYHAVTAPKIDDGAVITRKIADDAVTNDKLADGAVTTDKIATGVVTIEKLKADVTDAGKVATVANDGSVTYQTPTVDADDITAAKDLTAAEGDASITVTGGQGTTIRNTQIKVADGGITTAKLAADAVTTDKIAAGAVETSDLADDAVTTEKIKDGEVKTDDLADNAVTSDKINTGAVTPEKLSAEGVDAGNVATVANDGSVTYQTPTVAASQVTGSDDLDLAEDNANTTIMIIDEDGGLKQLASKNLTADDNSIVVTGGDSTTLRNTQIKVADEGITTAKLADDAVTSDKINNGAVTPEKLSAEGVDAGKVATVGNNGVVTYETPTVSAANITGAGSLNPSGTSDHIMMVNPTNGNLTKLEPQNLSSTGSITVTGGDGATLRSTTIEVAENGIEEDMIQNNAVTSAKIATGAVETSNLADDAVTTDKIAAPVNGNLVLENQVLTTNDEGEVEWTDKANLVDASNGLTKEANGEIQLGGQLTDDVEIDLAGNDFALKNLPVGDTTDNMVVIDPTTGDLKQMKAAPRFFYMPAVIFNTADADPGTEYKRDLYAEYQKQFTGDPVAITGIDENGNQINIGTPITYNGGLIRSTNAPQEISTYGRGELYYYISYYDQDVFENLSIDEDGVLTYEIKAGATETSYMNIIFVVK